MPLEPEMPEGSVINAQILSTSYFDADGKMMYSVGIDGDINIAQALGLLVLSGIKLMEIYKMNNEIQEDEEDDDE